MRKLTHILLIAFFTGFLSVSARAQALPSQKPKAALFSPQLMAKLEMHRRQAAAAPVRPGGPAVLPSEAPDPGKTLRIKAGTRNHSGRGTQGKLPSTRSPDSILILRPRKPQ
jgi:hypothetical protein